MLKLLFKLSLTVFALFMLLLGTHALLPSILGGLLRIQLEQQGFADIELDLGHLDLQSASLERLRMSSDEYLVSLSGLYIEYQLSELLSGSSDLIQVDSLSVTRLGADTDGGILPEPALLAGMLAISWHEIMPSRVLKVSSFNLLDEDKSLTLSARGELVRRGHQISGEFRLSDNRQIDHQVHIDLSTETGIDLQLFSVDGRDSIPLSVSLHPNESGNGLRGDIRMDLEELAQLPGIPKNLGGQIEADLSYFSLRGTENNYFELSLQARKLRYGDVYLNRAMATLNGLFLEQGKEVQLEFSDTSRAQLYELQQGINRVGELDFKLPAMVSIQKGGLMFGLEQGSSLSLSDIRAAGISVTTAQLEDIALSIGVDEGGKEICRYASRLTVSEVEADGRRISFLPVQLQGSCMIGGQRAWRIEADTGEIEYEDQDYRVSLSRCHGTIGNSQSGGLLDDNPDELGGAFSCQSSGQGSELRTAFRLNPVNGVGRASFSLPTITPNEAAPLIGGVIKRWEQPFEIVSGSLSLAGVYRWWENQAGEFRENLAVEVNMRDAGGYYDKLLFSGLNYTGALELLPDIRSKTISTLEVAHVDAGIPVDRISLELRLDRSTQGRLPALTINNLVIPVFDGEITGSDLQLDLNAGQQQILLRAVGLDLAKIIEMQQLDGLSVSGRLDGHIPLTITASGVSVSDGRIRSQAGGRIQYVSPDSEVVGQTAPGSGLLLDILEDLLYESLAVDLDYREDGQMEMALAIRGKSPHVDEDRPVHFNLNLQQNVLKLLQQLRYTSGISDSIDRNVKEFFSERTDFTN